MFQITWREPCDLTCSEACSPPADGSDSRDKPKLYRLQLSVTEVGTEKFDDSSIQVLGRWAGPGWGRGDRRRLSSWLRRERRSSSTPRALACSLFSGTRGCFYRVLQETVRAGASRGPHAVGGRYHARSARRSGWTRPGPGCLCVRTFGPCLFGPSSAGYALSALISQLWSHGAEDPCPPSCPQQSTPAIRLDRSIIIS